MNSDLYNLTQNTQGQLFYAMRQQMNESLPPLPPALQIRPGYAESPGWFMVQAAEFAPEPLTVQNVRVRDIYASERIVQALLELLAGERWLDREGEAYHLTKSGQALITQLQNRSQAMLTASELPMPSEQLNKLEANLRQIIDNGLVHGSGTPPWCLAHSRNRAPGDDTAVALKLNQYFSDFNAFRDDAHMAAWQPKESEGYIWEAFSVIAGNTANNATDIYDTLFYRGYSKGEYQAAINALISRNWVEVEVPSDNVRMTPLGKDIHKEVEQLTDAYFFAPWKLLSQEEQAQTVQLLQQLFDQLEAVNGR